MISKIESLSKEISISHSKHDDKNEPLDLSAADLREMVPNRGRHWDPNPMGSQSQSQIFGIGIGIGIDFSEFWDWDWDWDRFFKILGLGLGLGLRI